MFLYAVIYCLLTVFFFFCVFIIFLFFFFNDTAPTEIYTYSHTLSLHDALPIWFGPLLAPLLFMGLTSIGESKARGQMEKPLEIAIVGADNAPNLVSWLAGQGIERKDVVDPEAAVRAQDEDAYLSIGEDFAEDWRAGTPAVVEIVHDSTRRDSGIPVRRIERALELYGQQVGALRLVARGINRSEEIGRAHV